MASYVFYSDPYTIPPGWKQTTTPQGGTAFQDPQGNLYTRTASGFQPQTSLPNVQQNDSAGKISPNPSGSVNVTPGSGYTAPTSTQPITPNAPWNAPLDYKAPTSGYQGGPFGTPTPTPSTPTATSPTTSPKEGDIRKNASGQWETYDPTGHWVPTSAPSADMGNGSSSSSGSSSDSSGTGNTTSSLDQASIDALHFLGWTDDQIASASSSDAQNWAMIGEYLQKQTTLQGQLGTINAQNLNQAYQAALNDPTLKAKYGDMQATDVYNFQQSLTALQNQANTTSQSQQLQFQQDQQNLQNQVAQAGQAYSGFRNQAQGQLNSQESNIIQSTRAQLQQNLNNLVSTYQQKYGNGNPYGLPTFSSLFPAAAQTQLNYLDPTQGAFGYNPQTGLWGPTGQTSQLNPQLMSGNLVGTLGPQYESDLLSTQQNIYQGLGTPPTPTS